MVTAIYLYMTNLSMIFLTHQILIFVKVHECERNTGEVHSIMDEKMAAESSESVIATSKPFSHMQQRDVAAPQEQNSNSKLQKGIEVSSASPIENVTLNRDGSAVLHCYEVISESEDYEKEGRPQHDALGLGNSAAGLQVSATEFTAIGKATKL